MSSLKPVKLIADHALLPEGWARQVAISIDPAGRIGSVQSGATASPDAFHCGVLLPALANVHSHSFQRALAGLTESRGPTAQDSFWTWRELMYRFLAHLTPDDVQAIGAFVFMESLKAGYAAIGEFHYLHHQADGTPYADLAEMAGRLAAAAGQSGIGLTLLPVLYQQGGCDGRALVGGQRRFANTTDRFARLHSASAAAVSQIAADCVTGVAPHSLRAVTREALGQMVSLAPHAPIHLHIAEQTAEIDEVQAAYGMRPVHWLLEHHPITARWCLVHATHMTEQETRALAASGAVAGLCPITEANLGDGIFNASMFLAGGGRLAVGSDSNVRISLVEELRLLEYSQRLRDRSRAVLASANHSTGRVLYTEAARGGAQALGREAGRIAPGQLADLIALDADSTDLAGLHGDTLLDTYLFAGSDGLITDVWSAGRHVIKGGTHAQAAAITRDYRRTIDRLRALL